MSRPHQSSWRQRIIHEHSPGVGRAAQLLGARGEWDVTTDVAGVVARQEGNQPRGKSSPFNSQRAYVVPHVRAHMEYTLCWLLPC